MTANLEKSLELPVIIAQISSLCSFSMGKELIESSAPSFDPLVIRRDNQLMKEALACDIHHGPMPFGGIRDLRTVLQNAQKGRVLTGNDLCDVMRLIRGLRSVVSYEKNIETEHESIHDLVSSIVIHDRLERELSSCINDYGEVMDSASSELAEIRRSLSRADKAVADAVQHFLSTHASSVVDSIVTYRSGRAVVLVRAAEKNSFGGLLYGDSASGQASYIEPAALMNANNRKQELAAKEEKEVARILSVCSKSVGEYAPEELSNLETAAVLDALFAKAEWGRQRDAVTAVLTTQKNLILKKARHPLIDPKKVVPNNYNLCEPKTLLLITGPNTGGKTVSMKIIGLFVLMTYCGMPVTCDEAVIPYFDHVFADIGDDQSVVSSLSSFSASVEKLADVTEHATGNSLALLDEIGSGTDPREGEALAISILNELRQRGTMTVATTHYSRLKAYGKRHDDILTASVQFDMESLAPTYKYIEGITGQSNALEVASRYGLSKGIISYARFLKDQAKTQEDQLIERLERQLNETERKNEALEEKLKEITEFQKKLHHDRVNFEREKDEWKNSTEQEARKYIDDAREQADEILRKMREMAETARYHEVLEQRQKLNRKGEGKKEPADTPVLKQKGGYRVGDTVELRSSGAAARIAEIRRKDIIILLNGREMKVSASAIRPSLKVLPKEKPVTMVNMSASPLTSSLSAECNLIGMHVDEAMDEMASYMDQARIYGLKSFRIIHGDGSGALRKAVHDKLKKMNDVEEYRLGMPQEGGSGATVVKMKD